MEVLAKKEREDFLPLPVNNKEESEKVLKSLVEDLLEELLRLNHHPLVVRVFQELFPEEEKEKIPRYEPIYEPIDVEKITIGMLKELKRVQIGLKDVTEKVTQMFNQKDLSRLNSDFRKKLRGEWTFAQRLLKEVNRVLSEIQNEVQSFWI